MTTSIMLGKAAIAQLTRTFRYVYRTGHFIAIALQGQRTTTTVGLGNQKKGRRSSGVPGCEHARFVRTTDGWYPDPQPHKEHIHATSADAGVGADAGVSADASAGAAALFTPA